VRIRTVIAYRNRAASARVGIFLAKIDGFSRAHRCSEQQELRGDRRQPQVRRESVDGGGVVR
jgi:hypothetical protein